MFNRDPIFWWASGIFILALVLFGITQNDLLLALMVVSYLLRPTLASLGMAKRYVDERQLSLNYRSSNIAFFMMMIACVFFAAKLKTENNHSGEMFYMVIVIGIAAKALFNTLLVESFLTLLVRMRELIRRDSGSGTEICLSTDVNSLVTVFSNKRLNL